MSGKSCQSDPPAASDAGSQGKRFGGDIESFDGVYRLEIEGKRGKVRRVPAEVTPQFYISVQESKKKEIYSIVLHFQIV